MSQTNNMLVSRSNRCGFIWIFVIQLPDDQKGVAKEFKTNFQTLININIMSQRSQLGSEKSYESQNAFREMRQILEKVSIESFAKNQEASNKAMEQFLEQTKTIASLNQQVLYYKETLLAQQHKMRKMEEEWEKNCRENQIKNRRQAKKYIQLINQKQVEIQNLKKNSLSLNNRISTLTFELSSLSSAKSNLQETIAQSIETMKSQIKECSYSIDQNDLDKIVLENKYKQVCDKSEQVAAQFQESETRRLQIERKYQNLKSSHQKLNSECMELKFQVQKYRQREGEVHNLRKTSKIEELEKDYHQIKQISNQTSGIMQILQNVQDLHPTLETSLRLENQINNLKTQNAKLQSKLQEKEDIIQNLKIQLDGKFEDQLLRERRPSLYDNLLSKKKKIEEFENKLNSIEVIAKGIQENEEKNHENQHIIDERESLAMRIEELEIKLQKLEDQNEEIDRQRRHYKLELHEMVEIHENKKKKGQRTKKKIRCTVCLLSLASQRQGERCLQCKSLSHPECLKEHICYNKEFDTSSVFSQTL